MTQINELSYLRSAELPNIAVGVPFTLQNQSGTLVLLCADCALREEGSAVRLLWFTSGFAPNLGHSNPAAPGCTTAGDASRRDALQGTLDRN